MVWLHLADVPSDDDNDTSRDVLAMLGIPTDGTPGEQLWALLKLFGELVMQLASAGEYKLLAVIGSMLAGSLFSIALTCWVLSSWSWYGLLELVPALALDGTFTGGMLYYTLGIVCVVEVGSYLWEPPSATAGGDQFPVPAERDPKPSMASACPTMPRVEVLGAMEQLAEIAERLEGRDPSRRRSGSSTTSTSGYSRWTVATLIGFAVGSLMILDGPSQPAINGTSASSSSSLVSASSSLATASPAGGWRRFRRAQDVLNEVNAAAGNMRPPPCTSVPPGRSAARRRVCSASAARFSAVVGLCSCWCSLASRPSPSSPR